MSSTENSATIARWGDEAFGNVADLCVLIDRAEQKLAELREAISQQHSSEQIGFEAADVETAVGIPQLSPEDQKRTEPGCAQVRDL